jgi:hypothetical protein
MVDTISAPLDDVCVIESCRRLRSEHRLMGHSFVAESQLADSKPRPRDPFMNIRKMTDAERSAAHGMPRRARTADRRRDADVRVHRAQGRRQDVRGRQAVRAAARRRRAGRRPRHRRQLVRPAPGADGKGKGFDVPVLGGLRGDIPLEAPAAR